MTLNRDDDLVGTAQELTDALREFNLEVNKLRKRQNNGFRILFLDLLITVAILGNFLYTHSTHQSAHRNSHRNCIAQNDANLAQRNLFANVSQIVHLPPDRAAQINDYIVQNFPIRKCP